MNLPVYKLVIDEQSEDLQVDAVALVDKPAIERNFLAFNAEFVKPKEGETESEFIPRCVSYMVGEGKDQEQAVAICYSMYENKMRKEFAIQSEEERIITGPAMLADTPIYRNDERGEYYVVFDAPTIKKIAQKYFAKGFQNNVNLQHDKGQIVEGVTVFESWIVDSKRGIAPMKGFENVPEGSWFISMKVNDDATWQKVKAGEIKGFSVEGVFEYKIANTPEQMLTDALKNFHTVLEQMKTFNI